MKIDLEKVRERIRKLQEVERIASDPEMMALLEAFSKNGRSSVPNEHIGETETTVGVTSNGTLKADKPGKRGYLIGAVRDAAMREDGPFDGYALTKKMKDEGFAFQAEKPEVAVMDALRSLVKKGEFKVSESGKAGQPSRFVKAGDPVSE